MAEEMNTPFEEQREELTIKFAKGVCSEPFMSKDGKELVRIKIPNADENDHRPWQSFVLGAKQVHENRYGKGLWAKLLVDGHTTVSRPFPDGTDDKGRKIWTTERREVSNRELKEMVEYYKPDVTTFVILQHSLICQPFKHEWKICFRKISDCYFIFFYFHVILPANWNS